MFQKQAGRYASQPSFPQQMQPSGMTPFGSMGRSSMLFPFTAGTNLGSAAQAAQQNPNPVANPAAPKPGLATTDGIQQTAQKAAQADWLSCLIPLFQAQIKSAEASVAGGSASSSGASGVSGGGKSSSGGVSSSGFGTSPAPNAQQAQAPNRPGQSGQMGGGMAQGMTGGQFGMQNRAGGAQVGAYGIVQPGWSSLRPNTPGFGKAAFFKNAGMAGPGGLPPTPGVTANQPAPPGPAGMMPPAPPGMPAMPPPNGGAPVPQGMGAPSVDPNTGQPMQPPAGGAPPGGGGQPAPPPGAVDPKTGQPLSSPMQDAVPPPLPANPRTQPPRMPTMGDHQQGSVMEDLGAQMDQASEPRNKQEALGDIQAEAAALGSKTARDWLSYLRPSTRTEKKAMFRGDPVVKLVVQDTQDWLSHVLCKQKRG